MSEWNGIEGVAAWRDKLQSMLEEANRAAKGAADEPRFKLSRRLTAYIEHSRPQSDDMNRLDTIAGDTAIALMQITVDQRLASLTERGVELARFTKELDGRASAALASAEAIRLTRAKGAVEALTRSVSALNELRSALDGALERDLADQVEALIASIQDVRSAIEQPAAPRALTPVSRSAGRRGGRSTG